MSERYSFSLTTFSPSGKLVQIDYALNAVTAGSPSVGIKVNNGVVLACEKKFRSELFEPESFFRVETLTHNVGVTYSGMGPDFRVLVRKGRKAAMNYLLKYAEDPFLPHVMRSKLKPDWMPPTQLTQQLASVMQEYTQSGGVRPFGVSVLLAGWDYDQDRPFLYQCDPSGAYFPLKATAIGKNHVNAKTFLEKRYRDDEEIDDAVVTAIATLKESFEGQMTSHNVEIGICDVNGFRRLTPEQVKDHLPTEA